MSCVLFLIVMRFVFIGRSWVVVLVMWIVMMGIVVLWMSVWILSVDILRWRICFVVVM